MSSNTIHMKNNAIHSKDKMSWFYAIADSFGISKFTCSSQNLDFGSIQTFHCIDIKLNRRYTMRKLILLVLTMTFLVSLTLSAADFGAQGAIEADNLTLADMLTYAIQDEYLARAEYMHIIQTYGSMRPFSNIVKAEETHISLLTPLFEQYGYEIPEDNADEHVVIPDDIKTALEFGVDAEIANIAMYEVFLKEDLPADVRDVFERLMAASENHLEAFRRALRRYAQS